MRLKRTKLSRRGLLLVGVLGTLILLSLLVPVWLEHTALERRQVRTQQDRMQAEYLARAGGALAEARLAADADYAGETWRIVASELGGANDAEIVIRIEPKPDEPARRRVIATAALPHAGPRRIQRQWQTEVTLPPEEQP